MAGRQNREKGRLRGQVHVVDISIRRLMTREMSFMKRPVAMDSLNEKKLKIFLRRVRPSSLVDDVGGGEQELEDDDDGDEEAHSRFAGRDDCFGPVSSTLAGDALYSII